MPTARELLEQADALMRRNRERANDDIPVLTDAVPQHVARSAFAPQVLPVEAPPAAADVGDDVPLLTDEVEEIDAVAIDAAVHEGEPSAWLDFDAAEPSVIGDAPDSIAIVPPVDLRRPETPSEIDAFDELDDELAAAVAAAPPEHETLQPSPSATLVPERAVPPVPPVPSVPHTQSPSHQPSVIAGGAAALLHGDMAALAPTRLPAIEPAAPPTHVPSLADLPPAMEIADAAEALPADAAPWPEVAPDGAHAESVPQTDAPPVPDAAHAEPVMPDAPSAPDAAQWDSIPPPVPLPAAAEGPNAGNWEAMAEEIRMQVLQRIDLFTDTGLRTQLGERLQPIVDRASADLVATINQHVGELLRAYVAEAIEREIDSWRRNH